MALFPISEDTPLDQAMFEVVCNLINSCNNEGEACLPTDVAATKIIDMLRERYTGAVPFKAPFAAQAAK